MKKAVAEEAGVGGRERWWEKVAGKGQGGKDIEGNDGNCSGVRKCVIEKGRGENLVKIIADGAAEGRRGKK